jgi:hypothetical protein
MGIQPGDQARPDGSFTIEERAANAARGRFHEARPDQPRQLHTGDGTLPDTLAHCSKTPDAEAQR